MRRSQKQALQRGSQQRNRTIAKVQIRVALFMALSLCLLVGCQQPQPYGNFAAVDSVELVEDALNALQSAYSPAKTSLVLLQSVEDAFGLSLVDSLRNGGYAVAEYAPSKKGDTPLVSANAGLGFAYTLDALRDGGELRVTLHVGEESLSRLYLVKGAEDDASYVPVGFWARREGGRHAGR
jgi:hypothetical protein